MARPSRRDGRSKRSLLAWRGGTTGLLLILISLACVTASRTPPFELPGTHFLSWPRSAGRGGKPAPFASPGDAPDNRIEEGGYGDAPASEPPWGALAGLAHDVSGEPERPIENARPHDAVYPRPETSDLPLAELPGKREEPSGPDAGAGAGARHTGRPVAGRRTRDARAKASGHPRERLDANSPEASSPGAGNAGPSGRMLGRPGDEKSGRAPLLRRLDGVSDPDWDGQARRRPSAVPARSPGTEGKFRSEPPVRGKAPRPRSPPRPATLRRLLGLGPLKPPSGKPVPPDFALLRDRPLPPLEDGSPVQAVKAGLQEIEGFPPPGADPAYPRWREDDRRIASLHWHESESGSRHAHEGGAWASVRRGRWLWLLQSQRRWWTQNPEGDPLLWHRGRWWWRSMETWFLLHEGEPWALRWMSLWRREGLIHPSSGTTILYSSDGARAAVRVPGQGAVLFDLRSGAALARWEEWEL